MESPHVVLGFLRRMSPLGVSPPYVADGLPCKVPEPPICSHRSPLGGFATQLETSTQRRLAAILVADVVSYSRLMKEL